MISESARMSSMAEARFRVQAPNSVPRSTKVIALDAAGDTVVRRLADAGRQHTAFFTVAAAGKADAADHTQSASPSTLADLAGRRTALADEIDGADLVVLVAGPGGGAHAASLIGEACSQQRVTTTGFIVGAASASQSALSKTLAQLRPWSLMVVIASNDEYIDDMLTALRA